MRVINFSNLIVVLKILFLRSQTNIFVGLTIAALLLLANVNLIDTGKILVVCLLQIYSGAILMERLFYRRPLSVFERFGLGLPVGVAVSVAADLLFVQTAITQFAWVIPIIVIIALSWISNPRTTPITSFDHKKDSEALVWVVIGLFAVLGQEWFWPMPAAVFFMFASAIRFGYLFKYKSRSRQIKASQILYGFGAVTLFIGLLVRPFSWWIEDSDFGFYEAFTYSLSNWGISDNLLATGTGLRYHWFVYEWSGLVSKSMDLTNWVMLSRGVIIVGSYSLVCLIWSILSRVTNQKKIAVFALLIVCFFDSVTSWGSGFRIGFISSPSQLVGFIWLFAIVLLVLDQDHQRVKLSPFLYIILFSGAMLSKVSHGVIALGGLLTVVLFEMLSTRKVLVPRFADAVTALAVTIFWFWRTYLGAENAQLSFLKFPEELLGTLKLWEGKPLWLAAAILLFGLVGYPTLGLVVGLVNESQRKGTLLIFSAGAGFLGLVVTLNVKSLFGSQLYFLHSASSVVLVITALLTIESIYFINSNYQSSWRIKSISVVGFLGAVVSWLIPTLNSGSESAIWISISKSGTFAIPIILSFIFVLPTNSRFAFRRFSAIALVGLCGLGIGFSMTNWTMVLKREFPSFNRNEVFNLGTTDLNSAMNWVEANTPQEIIFASNNESFLLSALSHRRGFLQSEEYVRRHTVLNSQWNDELTARRELVDRAFKSMSSSDLIEFSKSGVSTLIIDKSVQNIALASLPSGLTTRFENKTFIVLEID